MKTGEAGGEDSKKTHYVIPTRIPQQPLTMKCRGFEIRVYSRTEKAIQRKRRTEINFDKPK
jgi:hypothetical protein